jgi:hypothetical protein
MSMPEQGSHEAQWERHATEEQRQDQLEATNNELDGVVVRQMIYDIAAQELSPDPYLPEIVNDLIETENDRGINGLLCKLMHAALTEDSKRANTLARTILEEAAANAREFGE